MDIQQVREVRSKVMASDGQVRTVVSHEPVADAEILSHDGQTFHTKGNGVFTVPEEIGRQLVGGLFRDLSDPDGGFTRARINLTNQNKIASAPNPREVEVPAELEAPQAPLGVPQAAADGEAVPNAAAPPPEGLQAPQAAAPAKKATRKRAPRKAAAKKK